MSLFLDSSAIIELFKDNRSVTDVIANASEVYTSSICAYEVLLGEKYREEKGMHSYLGKIQQLFEEIATLPFTYKDSIKASAIMAKLSAKGKKVDEFDVMIAAQALAVGAIILTKDAKHFEVLREEIELPMQSPK